MIKIENEHPRIKVNKRELAGFLRDIALLERRLASEVTVFFVTDRKIAKLHGEFMNDPTPTDVITFDISMGDLLSGDIFISLDTAERQAQEYGVSTRQEVYRLGAHGILHLCGYSDRTLKMRTKMRERENRYLRRFPWYCAESML